MEIKYLLPAEKFDVLFLTETDVIIQKEKEFQIEGCKTVLPLKLDSVEKSRIICHIKNEWFSKITIRNDIMSKQFASIWIEIKTSNLTSSIIGGFYRE